MRAYFDEKGIVLYNADCREILPHLPHGCADMILTDPPYGVKWRSNHRNEAFAFIKGDENAEAASMALELALPLLKRHGHIYTFGRFDFSRFSLTEPVELIWDKEIKNSGDLLCPWGRQHEYIEFRIYNFSRENLLNGAGRLSARLRKGSVLRAQRHNATEVRHPTEKPVEILREMIESSSFIGDTVLDFFAGVGSTLDAAKLEGRRAIGIEIEEKYCEIAAKRLSQEVLEFT